MKKKKIINIAIIDTTSFDLLIKNKKIEIFVISLKDVNYELKKKSKTIIDSKIIVFEKYHDFLNVFLKKTTNIFLSHRKYDHKIELLEKKIFCTRISLSHVKKRVANNENLFGKTFKQRFHNN